MSLSVNSVSSSSLSVAHGQVKRITATIDSTSTLAGKTIRVFLGLFEASPIILQYPTTVNYFEVAYPGAPGTSAMTWVGTTKFQNLEMSLQHVSTTQFILTYDFVVGADRYTINDNLTPLELITPRDLQFSIYEQLRYLNLHVFEIGTNNKTFASIMVMGTLPKTLFQDNFQYNLRLNSTGESVARPLDGQDLIIDFTLENSNTLNGPYDILIFNNNLCALNDQLLTVEENLDLEGGTSPTPTALPSLSITNIISMTNISNVSGNLYKGQFILDGARINAGCDLGIYIIVYDVVNRPFSYSINIIPETLDVPEPDVTVTGVIEGDASIYSTSSFANIAPGQKFQGNVAMDTDDYNTKLAALGLPGNYSENLIVINVYALNHKPINNEDLSQYPILDQVGGPPLAIGAAFYNYQVPADVENVTFLIFDYVFKDHSIRVPIKLLHPVLAPFDTIEFRDLSNNLLNSYCYDYSDGLKVRLQTSDANAFDFNTLRLYAGNPLNDEDLSSVIVDGSITGDSDQIDFTLDLNKVEPGQCFMGVGSRVATVSEAIGSCLANTIAVNQVNSTSNLISITLENTLGPGFAFPRSYLTVKRSGVIIAEFSFDDDWTTPIVKTFDIEFLNLNTLNYTLVIYTEDGCEYYTEFNLTTNRFISDNDSDVLVVDNVCS